MRALSFENMISAQGVQDITGKRELELSQSVSPMAPRASSRPSSESPITTPQRLQSPHLQFPLHLGWQQFKDTNGQYLYVNHSTKERSRMDPRLGQPAKELSGHKPMSRKSEEHRRLKEQRAEGHSLMSYRHKDAKRLFESDSE